MADGDTHDSLEDYPLDDDYTTEKATEATDAAERPPEPSQSPHYDADGRPLGNDDVVQRRDKSLSDRSYTFGRYRGAGSGTAIDEAIDDESPQPNDGRSVTRTTFWPSDGPQDQRRHLKKLADVNDGMYHTERKAKNLRADARRWAESFCSTLDLSPYQQDAVIDIVEAVDMQRMGNYSSMEVILGSISLVCERDRRLVRDESAYRDLVVDADSDRNRIKQVRKMLRSRINWLGTSG